MSSNNEEASAKAKRRWKLLIDVLSKKRLGVATDNHNEISVRRFSSFGLLQTESIGFDTNEPEHCWFRYTCDEFKDFKAQIRHLSGTFGADDLTGYNNTGNVCVWPSEEVMAFYCLKHRDLFRNSSVLEIGGGMTCLAGLAVALCCDAKSVIVTDGNEKSVANLKSIIEKEDHNFGQTRVTCDIMRWDNKDHITKLNGPFDKIVCADCLFFDDHRQDLVTAVFDLLKDDGEALIFAPTRGDTFDSFQACATALFDVERFANYDDKIWNHHMENIKLGNDMYDANIHYPEMLLLKKKTCNTMCAQ